MLEHVIVLVGGTVLDLPDLLPDAEQRIAEPVELGLRLGLRRFDHEGSSDGPAHRWGVEAIVDEPLGDILGLNSGRRRDGANVDDELVGARAVLSPEEDRVVVLEPLGHVVGIENGHLRGILEALGAHHGDVRVRDWQDQRGPVWSRSHAAEGLSVRLEVGVCPRRDDRVRRHERRQVGLDADGSHSWTASSVGDAERLVQVQVAHVSSDDARRREADLGVHIGAIHVHLTAVLVDDPADLVGAILVDTMGGRVRDHEGCQVVLMLYGLGANLLDVDVALGVDADRDNLHACHDGGGRVGSVGRNGDDADVPVSVIAGPMVLPDGHETGVLTGGPAIGLQGDGIKAGDGGKLSGKVLEHLLVSLGLIKWHVRMEVGELGPSDGEHLRGGIELHRARSERDHRVRQRQIHVLELLQVAKHLVLGVARVENRVLHELRGPGKVAELWRDSGGELLGGESGAAIGGEGGKQVVDVLNRRRLVHGHAHDGVSHDSDVHSPGHGGVGDGLGVRDLNSHSVEEGTAVPDSVSELLHSGGKHASKSVNAIGDLGETLRSVVHPVHAGNVGQEGLGRANVRSGLVPPDVLLPGLHGHTEGRLTLGITGHPNNPSRKETLVLGVAGQEGRVRASVSHGHTKPLGGSDDDIGAPLSGRRQLGERERIRGDANLDLGVVGLLGHGLVVADGAVRGRVLHEHAAHVFGHVERSFVDDLDLKSERGRPGLADLDGLRVTLVGDQEANLLAPGDGAAHGHGLGRSRGLVEERGVGHLHAGQVAHHRLEVEQGLETPLRNLRLVGRVLGVPARVLEQVPEDDRGNVRSVVPHPDEALEHLVLGRHGLEVLQELRLCHSLVVLAQGHAVRPLDGIRHGRLHQRLHALEATQLRHFRLLLRGDAVVPGGEHVAGLEGLHRDCPRRSERQRVRSRSQRGSETSSARGSHKRIADRSDHRARFAAGERTRLDRGRLSNVEFTGRATQQRAQAGDRTTAAHCTNLCD
mmetsp:Transcript_2617/g.7893  ORF Transcript_2617/g.7893 Transcript_2617/m.7893 type:complete len:987 (-) Transcript_2617:315-3275(-)